MYLIWQQTDNRVVSSPSLSHHRHAPFWQFIRPILICRSPEKISRASTSVWVFLSTRETIFTYRTSPVLVWMPRDLGLGHGDDDYCLHLQNKPGLGVDVPWSWTWSRWWWLMSSPTEQARSWCGCPGILDLEMVMMIVVFTYRTNPTLVWMPHDLGLDDGDDDCCLHL